MFYKIKSVLALKNFILKIIFENNEIKYYDVKPLFEELIEFKNLKNVQGLFDQVKVDVGGYGISWNDELDLSCNELYFNSKKENI